LKSLSVTGPRRAIHDVGLWLDAGSSQLPWVVDFRDPYLIDFATALVGSADWPRRVISY
jgi:hypothetical protein